MAPKTSKKTVRKRGWPTPGALVRELKKSSGGDGKPPSWDRLAEIVGGVTEVNLRRLAADDGAVCNSRLYARLCEIVGYAPPTRRRDRA